MTNLFSRHRIQAFVLVALTAIYSFSVASESIDLEAFLPNNSLDYRSYIGSFSSDTEESDVHVREETSRNFFINDKRTFRIKSQASSTFNESNNIENLLSTTRFETSHNGWLMFREDIGGQILEYKHPAKILPKRPEIGKSYKYKAFISEDSPIHGVVGYHTLVEELTTISLNNGTFEALKINQEKRIKLASDEKMKEITYAATEYFSYWLVQGVGIVKETLSRTSYDEDSSEAIDARLELVASNYLPHYLWPNAEETESGWKHVDWFGYLTDKYFPWVYHKDHGWLWIDAKDLSDIKLWSESLGWWITSSQLYPTFYSVDLREWLTYNGESDLERTFVRSDGSVVKASLQGFSASPELSKPPNSANESLLEQEGNEEFYDSDGIRYIDSSSGFTADQGESPSVEILAPFEGTILEEGERFLILADANDKDGEITQVKIIVNGSVIELLEDEPYQTSMTTNDADATYNIQAIAVDNDGNVTQTEVRTIQVDLKNDIAPEVRIYSPVNKSVIKTNTWIKVELKASDEDGFVKKVYLLVDGIPVGDPLERPPYQFSFRPPVDGDYQISGKAIDEEGNEATAQAITVTATKSGIPSTDEKSPEIRISNPLNKSTFGVGTAVSIQAEASDSDGEVDEVKIYVDGIQIGETLYSYPYKISYAPPVAGSYKITATAEDDDENLSTSSTITITIE